jgi:dipeptidyl aminopeptidase/acylaminoacyl peptidase
MNMNRFLLSLIVAATWFGAAHEAKAEPYPLEYWALRDVMSNVEVSPDGEYLGLLKIPARDADPVLEVYRASNLDEEPFRIDGGRMEITSFDWVGNQDMVVRFRQKVRDKIDDFNQGVYEYKIALLDVKEEKIEQFRESNPAISNLLPNKPDKIIISLNPGMEDRGERLQRTFRPRAYYELDLNSGNKKLLMQGKLSLGQVVFNGDGDPWYARGFDRGKDEYLWYVRRPDSDDWEVIYRQHEDSFETFNPQGMDPEKPDTLLVVAHNGRDKTALWEFNINTKKFGEIIYARNDVNVGGTRFHSNPWTNPDTIVGVTYRTDKLHVEYFDPIEGATYAQLESVVPEAYQVYITSRSRDGQTLTIYNVGPKDPGTYYLLKGGALKAIGSKQPLLKSEDLAEVRYVYWKARDGMDLHGYLTIPTKGEAPYPLIVLPHGGPFVSETVVYDEWSQMLANNGYLVLQPQYRGSTNFGLEYYQSAFLNGGQGGYKMQDDKDDGALYLVEEGLADKDRIAMFGWSYGGYAALVAASRTPQIHQCVIAGAAVSDTLMQVSYYSDRMRGAQEVEQINMWRDSINPIKEADKVNVPILLVHGDVDQRVPPAHVRKYLDELEKYNKPHKYLELEGADHFSNTLFYEHQIKLYEAMIDYLKNDCGPGGL